MVGARSDEANKTLLMEWVDRIVRDCANGGILGRPISIPRVEIINGPRAGAIEFVVGDSGMETGKVLQALSRNDCALLRQYIPWQFVGSPGAFMSGRFLRLEAGWPAENARSSIDLSALSSRPLHTDRWVVGQHENGATVTASISDQIPHWLIGGQTGSGKTVGMQSICAQLAMRNDPRYRATDPTLPEHESKLRNEFILIDAKWGSGLAPLKNILGMVGPMAIDAESAIAALAWACAEMKRRYQTGDRPSRLVVFIDEIQDIAGYGSNLATEYIRQLVTKGRGASIHLIVGTQHPTTDVFGDPQTKRNLVGRLALRVDDYKASEVVVGSANPRADHLLGRGDGYVVVPASALRVQVAYPDLEIMRAVPNGMPAMDEWPAVDTESAGQVENIPYSELELAIGIAAAADGVGRDSIKHMFEDAGMAAPGSPKATKIRDIGRNILGHLRDDLGRCVVDCAPGEESALMIIPDRDDLD